MRATMRSMIVGLTVLTLMGLPAATYPLPTDEAPDPQEASDSEAGTEAEETEGTQDDSESPPYRVDEEMVVTAQKREQSIMDVGLSVTAFNSEDIRELNLREAKDIAVATPGLVASNTTGTPVFAIRGVGLDDYHPNNTSGVGTYIDEVAISSAAMLEFQLFDVERVEVLKGPQGTLYGRNTTGGAINYVSKAPTDETEALVELGIGRWQSFETNVAVGGPLSDSVNYRVAARYDKWGEGFEEDVSNGTEGGRPDKLGYRGLLSWEGEKADLLFNIHGGRDRSRISGWQADDTFGLGEIFAPIFGYPMASPGVPEQIATGDGFTSIDGPVPSRQDQDDIGANLRVNLQLGSATLTSITAWDNSERQRWENVDGSAWTINDDATFSDVTQISQELRLSGSNDTLDWVAGLYLFDQEVDGDQTALITNTIDVVYADLGIPFEFWPTGLGLPSSVGSDYVQQTDSLGIFGQTDWQLGEAWLLTVGLRYSDEEVGFKGNVQDNEGFFTGAFVPTVIVDLDDTQSDSRVSGRINLGYTPNDDWLIYVDLSTGFKSGVFFTNPVPDPVGWGWAKPEDLAAFELGFKGALDSGALRWTGATFFYDYKNKQVLTDVTFPGGVAPTLWNVPQSEIYGVETDVNWAFSPGWSLRAGVAWLQSEVTEAPTDIRGFPYDQIQAGDELSWAPEWTFYGTLRRFFTVGDNHFLGLQADYSYRDELQPIVGVGDDSVSFIDPLKLLGARVSYGANSSRWEISIWGRNLTDGDAVTYAYTNFLTDRSYSLQSPRSWGTTLLVRW